MDKRPVFLNLMKMHFPITAIVSILHRVSGVIIFFSLPFIIAGFEHSLSSESSFKQVQAMLNQPIYGFVAWIIVFAFVYHAIAGIRHLFMDIGLGETLAAGRLSGWIIIALSSLAAIYLGVDWLW